MKETTAREGFVATALAAVMAASCGAGTLFPSLPCGDPADYGNPRDATLACAAAAAVAVARGAEPQARQAYARHWPGGPSRTGSPNGTCAASWPSATS